MTKKLEIELYKLTDSFLTEAKGQNGNDRSLEQLNDDRHLFVKNCLTLIQAEREQAYEQGKTDFLNIPMGASQWINYGIKWSYEDFFYGKEMKKVREQAVKEVLDLLPKEYEGELDDFSSGFNICRNEIELKINKLKAKYDSKTKAIHPKLGSNQYDKQRNKNY